MDISLVHNGKVIVCYRTSEIIMAVLHILKSFATNLPSISLAEIRVRPPLQLGVVANHPVNRRGPPVQGRKLGSH